MSKNNSTLNIKLEERIFNFVSFWCMIMMFMVFLINVMDKDNEASRLVNIINLLFITIFALFYFFSRYKGYFQILVFPFSLYLQSIISLMWFIGGGINSDVTIFFLLTFIISIIILPNKYRKIYSVAVVLIFIVLVSIEFYFPDWVNYPLDDESNNKHLVLASMISLFLSYNILSLFKDQYDNHRSNLEEKNNELIRMTNEKSRFLASMSHEIRTPMNGVIGIADLLSNTKQTQENHELILTIITSGKRLLDIINEILDFSKIESGQLEINEHAFSLFECINEVSNLFYHQLKTKSLRFKIEIDESVPDLIIGDVGKLTQIFINLVGNAIKFTDQGSIKIKIEHSSNKVECLLIRVEDSGIGIPEEKQMLIFDAYSQIEEKNNYKRKGTGLGLTITKKLVEFMGGEITIESTQNIGSAFIFSFYYKSINNQRIIEELNYEKQKDQLDEKDVQLADSIPLKIIVADDDLINQKVIGKTLKSLGYDVEMVNNGQEVLNKLVHNKYNLLLLDIQMPILDGLETARMIIADKRLNENVDKIIALTANVMEEDRQKSYEAGMSDFLTKPIMRSDIVKVIKKWF